VNRLDPTLTSSYDYDLPKELIATTPLFPRDSAKLMVYYRDSNRVEHKRFSDIVDLIPKDTHLVFNNTKVVKARIFGKKSSGGKVELLLNRDLGFNDFSVYINGRVKEGTKLLFDRDLEAVVVKIVQDGSRVVKFFKDNQELDFYTLNSILEEIGHIPLPPYMNRDDNKKDEIDYQPLFAKNIGAVAAPTASLHFTPKLLEEVKDRFSTSFITLHVGAGTFKGVDASNIKEHNMHSEYYEISSDTKEILDSDKKVLALGTTVTRTVEFYNRTEKTQGECNLFLHPNNLPQRVDYLITNFHLPKSTLIMLVASFIGVEKTLELYNEAIKNSYRFYSYGDAMIIL
jgi:S-adenosylmethionine:tRNA ribosyltransferase-isomerase